MLLQRFDSVGNRPADLESAGILGKPNFQSCRALVGAALVPGPLRTQSLDLLPAQHFDRFSRNDEHAFRP